MCVEPYSAYELLSLNNCSSALFKYIERRLYHINDTTRHVAQPHQLGNRTVFRKTEQMIDTI